MTNLTPKTEQHLLALRLYAVQARDFGTLAKDEEIVKQAGKCSETMNKLWLELEELTELQEMYK